MAKLALSLTLAFLTPLVFGQCPLVPSTDPSDGTGTIVTDETLCDSQGAGTYTFGMSSSLSGGPFPLGSGGGELNENGGTSFLVMDNSCKILGVFPQPGCGVPYVLEANYLDYVLIVTSVYTGISEGYFSFNYGNGDYSIDNNHCGCSDSTEGLSASQSCKCAFPVAGQPTKRSIAFEA